MQAQRSRRRKLTDINPFEIKQQAAKVALTRRYGISFKWKHPRQPTLPLETSMDIHGIPIKSIWSFLRWLPVAILRKVFPKERLAQLQYVDVIPRHDSVVIDLSEAATFRIVLQIINLSPFEIELDRAEFSFYLAGTELKSTVLYKQPFEPGVPQHLTISGSISDGHANRIGRTLANQFDSSAAMQGWIAFNCSLHSFVRQVVHLDGVRSHIVNLEWRKNMVKG